MSTVDEIERAIEQLSPQELEKLSLWFADRHNTAWDSQINADAESGKLDFLFEEAATERQNQQLKDWPPLS